MSSKEFLLRIATKPMGLGWTCYAEQIMNIDKFLPYTEYGRKPCAECAIKHLSTAWFLLSPAIDSTMLLARVNVLLTEAISGYPNHRYLAVGILNFLEPFSTNIEKARDIRRAIYSGSNNITELPSYKTPVLCEGLREAHLIEALHESPIPLDLTKPVEVLIEEVLKLL